MAQQIPTKKLLNSTRLCAAVTCAGLCILSVVSGFVSVTHSGTDSLRLALKESVVTNALSQKKLTASEVKHPAEIALDYHPWQPGLSTFVVVREDGSVKLVRYDRHRRTVRERREGVLAPADVAELFATVRNPTVRRALRLRKRYTRVWEDSDLFYLTLWTKSGELTHWFSRGERAPQTIFVLVDKLLALNDKVKSLSAGSLDRYLRAERLTPQDTKAVMRKGLPLGIRQFPSALQEVIARAVAHPNEFFPITAEQARDLQTSRTSMLIRAASVYDLRLYDWSLDTDDQPISIKPPNKESHLTQVASPEGLAAANKSSSQEKMKAPRADKTAEIALDYQPWQPGLSTFVVVREDGSVKLFRYDRHHLTVSEHQEGVLAAADVAELFKTIRKPTATLFWQH